jgi:hypothetical protein
MQLFTCAHNIDGDFHLKDLTCRHRFKLPAKRCFVARWRTNQKMFPITRCHSKCGKVFSMIPVSVEPEYGYFILSTTVIRKHRFAGDSNLCLSSRQRIVLISKEYNTRRENKGLLGQNDQS